MHKAIIVGLTGQTGAGKSTVAGMLEKRGCKVISADKVYREVTEPGQPLLGQLALVFGYDVVKQDGSLNRQLLAKRAFASDNAVKTLNKITHPVIADRMQELTIDAFCSGYDIVVWDAPQLFEAGMQDRCQAVVSVVADKETRINRICKRDGLTREAAEQRISAQYDEQFFRENSGFVVENNGGKDALTGQMIPLMDYFEELMTESNK